LGTRDRKFEEFGFLGLLLLIDSLLAVVVARITPFYAPNDEYLYDGLVFAAHHRIYDNFLPVGYSGLLGVAAWLGGHAGLVVLTAALSLLAIVAGWFYLRLLGLSVRSTFVLTGLLSIYPDFLLSLHKAQETAVTAALIFGFVGLLLKATEEARFGAVDLGLAVTLTYAITVRANLALLVLVCWFVFWRLRLPRAVPRLCLQLLILVVGYVGITTALHGRPFLPQYGPYNLCSGFNEMTQDRMNEEDTLFAVLPAHHVKPPNGEPWFTAANLRDPSLNPVYTQLALQFVRQHPWRSIGLIGVKLRNLLRPNLTFHPAGSIAGILKIGAALGVPLWLAAMVVLPHPAGPKLKLILWLVAASYVVPFLLTVSAPRFREPLDLFCWLDLGAILWAWKTASARAGANASGSDEAVVV
jgi:hypothetical protein